jgi:hypothetical protein
MSKPKKSRRNDLSYTTSPPNEIYVTLRKRKVSKRGTQISISSSAFLNKSVEELSVVDEDDQKEKVVREKDTKEEENARKQGRSKNLRLYSYDEAPSFLQDNEYILHGYRCFYSTADCWRSVFMLHNEVLQQYNNIDWKYLDSSTRLNFWFDFYILFLFLRKSTAFK